MIWTYQGLLSVHSWGEADGILFLSSVSAPLCEELQWIVGERVTIRYWVTDKQVTQDEAITAVLERLDGVADGKFDSCYSEMTGYLWTDEKLTVGGHDLMAELHSATGSWLILEVEVL